jgi:hypothetical protein
MHLTSPWIAAPLLMLVILGATAPAMADADKRIALVIGNDSYRAAPLKNPVNDARAIAAKLGSLGFEVIELENASQKEMNRSITLLGERLAGGGVGLFYYAGHGMQVKGRNYLIPVDAEISSEASVRNESVDVDQVLEQLSASPLNIVILDACRNNPFERRFRGASGGLAQVDAPMGTVIAYATAPGKVASDGSGAHGLYTTELLNAMDVPGLAIEDIFKRVRVNVAKSTANAQVPWEASSLTGNFYFRAAPTTVAAPNAVAFPEYANPYEGTHQANEGVWSVVVTIKGFLMSGTLQCFDAAKQQWGGIVHFSTTIAADGSFYAYTESEKGWAARKVYGQFPEVTIAVLNPGSRVTCADGRVKLSKR